jgi:hypothetical protein
MASTPPSASARACSAAASAIVAASMVLSAIIFPVGPIEPNTRARVPAARREISAPARVSDGADASTRCRWSATRFDEKVLVRITCAPAST